MKKLNKKSRGGAAIFRGHKTNILWAIILIVLVGWLHLFLLFIAFKIVAIEWIAGVIIIIPSGIFFLISLSYAVYLFCELKHLLFQDGVADERDLVAVLIFSSLSIFGLVNATSMILAASHSIPILNQNVPAAIFLLSMLSSYGAVLGLRDLPAMRGLISRKIITISISILRSWKWLGLALGLGCFLTLICLGIETLLL